MRIFNFKLAVQAFYSAAGSVQHGCTFNKQPRQRSAATADGRDCRGAKAGQHDAAVSVPRTLVRGALHRNQRHFWYFWCQKYIPGSMSASARIKHIKHQFDAKKLD